MSNLRIISNNLAGSSVLTGTGTGLDNLKIDSKTRVWRTEGTGCDLNIKFSTPVVANCIAFPFTNLTSTARITLNVRSGGTAVGFPISAAYLAAPSGLGDFDWGVDQFGQNAYNQVSYSGTNTFSIGGGSYGVLWFDTIVGDEFIIHIDDVANTSGSIDISRLVIGHSWSPKYNADYGVEISEEDNGKQYRTDSGDLKFDTGVRYKKLSLSIAHMPPEDRNAMWAIIKRNGLSNSLFISVFPETDDDPELEQMHQVYGKLSSTSSVVAAYYNKYSTKLEIEEN